MKSFFDLWTEDLEIQKRLSNKAISGIAFQKITPTVSNDVKDSFEIILSKKDIKLNFKND